MMAPLLYPLAYLCQLPTPAPLAPAAHALPLGLSPLTAEAMGGAVLALVIGLVALRLRAKKAEAKSPAGAPPEIPGALPRVELPLSAKETALREQASDAHTRAEALAVQRRLAAQAAQRAGDVAERTRLEEEARALKAREEEAKRQEYQAAKAAERESKERRTRELEETRRQESDAAKQAQQDQAARERAVAEEAQRKVDAEGGRTLAQGLDRTRSQGFMARLNTLFAGHKSVDESVLVELEEVLFSADIGVRTASRLVELARDRLKQNELSDMLKVKAFLRSEVERILSLPAPRSLGGGGPPHVVMVVGVNGAGKTTTIGKLAAQLTASGKKVVLAAGDTFRAAATEQLDVWAERAGAELVKGADGSDPGSVVFEAIQRARATGADVVIADTAGRLHTKGPLMDELKKVRRVLDKALPGAPHEVLLVLDATNGQNAIAQAREFQAAVQVTDIALTKLDGTAKGGVIIGICDELKIPVAWVGIGEKVSDLRAFNPVDFVAALFDATPGGLRATIPTSS